MSAWLITLLEGFLRELGWVPPVQKEIREVQVPIYVDRQVEKVVEVEKIVNHEVPVDRIVDRPVEVERIVEVEKVVEREVPVIVEKFIDRVIQVPMAACEFCARIPPNVLDAVKPMVATWDTREDVSPEYKRHQVYAELLRVFPTLPSAIAAQAIEQALYEVRG